jgi:putative heme-binding domain-containing protein
VFRGFGVHAAFDGHDLHGLIAGPDGKLYFSVGDNGFSVTSREGRRWHHPNTGGVLRMNPDGSELEVFATGLRNVQEIAFDEWGNMFGVDNDGDLADERERFVFIAEGSDSGWRLHWQFREAGWARFTHQPNYNPWVDERMWVPYFPGQPAHITPPLSNYSVGPGSFRYNPGTALNEAYRGHFFLIQFPVAKVTAFRVQPKGAGFEMLDEHTLVSGMMASALSFGPDGGLYIGDWDGMWSPSGKGSVWRVDDPGLSTSAVRTEVREWLKQGPRRRAVGDLERALGHLDQRIRQAAQFELVRRRDLDSLKRVAQATNSPVLARVHALWGLGQGKALLDVGELPLADRDSRIRAQAAKVAGDARMSGAIEPLMRLLADPDMAVRFQAALALGKIGDPSAFDALRHLLEWNADQDPFLRHAAVMGWVGMRQIERLAALASHRAPAVRLAAVVGLRRLHSEAVAAYLQDPDEGVRRESVRAIHDDDSIPGALPALAALLETVMSQNDRPTVAEPGRIPGGGTPAATEAGLKGNSPRNWDVGSTRRMLHANLRLGTETSARRLARYASAERHLPELRLEALECLAQWTAEPALDRVQGFVRSLGERIQDLGDRMIGDHFGEIRRGADKPLLQALVRVVLEHRIAVDSAVFVEWCLSTDQPASIRAQVLELLAQNHPDRLSAVLLPCLASTEPELRMAAWRVQAARDPEGFMDGAVAEFDSRTLKERQALVRLVGSVPGEKARQWMDGKLDEQGSDRLAAELALDVLEAAAFRPEQDIRDKVAAAEDRLRSAPPWRSHRVALAGGDVERGREVFRSHPNGQCVRCHEAGGEGQQVGPVLKGIAGRVNREYLLESLIDPSARIADGFATVSLETREGEVWDGIRIAENDREITLRLGTGVVQTIRRSDIARQATSTVSAMPPMGEVLSRAEIRDLLEYLMTQK